MGRILLLTALGGLLAGTIAWAIWTWMSLGEAEISINGMIAMTLGIVFSLIVGCGLMILVFISARHGYDDRVIYDEDEDNEDR